MKNTLKLILESIAIRIDKAINELKNKKSLCIVEITNVNGEFSADKTTTEIVDMYKNGVAVFAEFADDIYQLNYADVNYCGFSFISGSVSKEISINSDGEVFFKTRTLVREEYDEEDDRSLPGGTTNIVDAIYAAYDKSDVFVVNVTGNVADGYVSDKTYEQIAEAYTDNKTIYAVVSMSGVADIILQFVSTLGKLRFTNIIPNDFAYLCYNLEIKSDNSVTLTNHMINKAMMLTEDTYDSLNTTNKTIVGAINEINDLGNRYEVLMSELENSEALVDNVIELQNSYIGGEE